MGVVLLVCGIAGCWCARGYESVGAWACEGEDVVGAWE